MKLNPFQIAIQGLGYQAAMVALQGLLQFVAVELLNNEQAGGGERHRKTTRAAPNWLPVLPVDEEDTLIYFGLL
jgi:hypothetical protein